MQSILRRTCVVVTITAAAVCLGSSGASAEAPTPDECYDLFIDADPYHPSVTVCRP